MMSFMPFANSRSARQNRHQVAFPALIFLAAFLLFSVQPIIGRFVLPWFGGSPSVWTTALLFFQAMLLAGYALAHLINRLGLGRQAVAYVALLLVAVAFLPIAPNPAWRPSGAVEPVSRLLLLLTLTVGLPYLALAAASPLLQAWAKSMDNPYRLYAWSNAGSLAGLLSYPLIVEPWLGGQLQARWWSVLFVAYAAAAAWLVYRAVGRAKASGSPADSPNPAQNFEPASEAAAPAGWRQRFLWLGLAFAASALLMAVTNYITQDLAAVPFLWVLPLSIYLLSFVLTFRDHSLYDRQAFSGILLFVSLLAVVLILVGGNLKLFVLLAAPLLVLAVFTLVCHGELYARRPLPSRLTGFYLWVSTGGALGGLFVAVIAPLIFPLYFEFHVSLLFALTLLVGLWLGDRQWSPLARRRLGRAFALLMLGAAAVALSAHAWLSLTRPSQVSRDFFGVLRVFDSSEWRSLRHGRILHGLQMKGEDHQCQATSYYGPTGGLGLAAALLPDNSRVGVVGLGVGTAAVYGDSVRFYEISPAVQRLAEAQFSFLGACQDSYEVVLGDARISLEREHGQGFDLLVLDAFTGDAIPIHLLTEEAFAIYLRHLRPDGLLAVHISNQYFDLKPVIAGLAERHSLAVAVVHDPAEGAGAAVSSSTWAVLSRQPADISRLTALTDGQDVTIDFPRTVRWTDNYSSLIGVLRLN